MTNQGIPLPMLACEQRGCRVLLLARRSVGGLWCRLQKEHCVVAASPAKSSHRGERTTAASRAPVTFTAMLLFFAINSTASATFADEPEIEAAVSAQEIFIGESIDYQIEIRNAENPVAPDVSALREHFDVISSGDQSRNQSSTFIINGRVSQQNVLSHIYLYRLTPKSAGDLTIPAVKATIDGKDLTSNAIDLRVQDAEQQDLVLAEIHPDQTTVYPTQPFTVVVRILVQPLPDSDVNPLQPLRRRPPHLQINWVDVPSGLTANQTSEWLQPLISESESGFTLNEVSASSGSFFGGSRAAVFDLSKGREVRNGLDGKPVEYFVYELSRGFTPEKTGRYSFGPALIKGTFVAGTRNGEYLARRLVSIAPAVSVEVREVPSPRPSNYTGGIGEYQVAAFASPEKLRVGDPLTLTLEFARGHQSGSLELISAPDLTVVPEIADDFEIIDRNPTGRVDGSVKRFAYALRPKRAGVTIPGLTLTTFDPSTEKFLGISTEQILLDVTEAAKISGSDLVGSIPATGTHEIRKSAQGIFQNITDPAQMHDERVSMKGWLVMVAGFWCFAGSLIAAVSLYRRRTNDTVWVRRQQARRTAHLRLSNAARLQTEGKSQDALREVRSAIVGLIADITNGVAEGMTAADVAAALSMASVPGEDRMVVLTLLESIEGAEYGAGDAADAAAAVRTAKPLIDRISPFLERSAGR